MLSSSVICFVFMCVFSWLNCCYCCCGLQFSRRLIESNSKKKENKKSKAKMCVQNEKKNRYSQAHNLKGSAPSHTHTNTHTHIYKYISTHQQASAPTDSSPNSFACNTTQPACLATHTHTHKYPTHIHRAILVIMFDNTYVIA